MSLTEAEPHVYGVLKLHSGLMLLDMSNNLHGLTHMLRGQSSA